MLVIVLAVTFGLPASSIPHAAADDRRSEEIRRIIAGIQASGPPADTDAVLAEPHGSQAAPEAPAVALRTAMAQLRGVQSPGQGALPPPHAQSVSSALADLTRAYAEFVGDDPDLSTVIDHIRAAVQRLEDSRPPGTPFTNQLEPPAQLLATTARHLASGILHRAAEGGVSRARVEQARVALARGDQLVVEGDLSHAIAQFGDVLTIGETLVFNLDLFEQNIKDALEGETVGYAYSIGLAGVLATQGADGLARTSTDPPQTDQSATKEMNIASVSKTITGVATLKLLEKTGLSVESSVAPLLPPEWNPHPSIDDLTFEDLLTQSSGLNGNVKTGFNEQLFAALEESVEEGINAADKEYFYQNQNFSLLRVILPYLWGVDPASFEEPVDVVTAATYIHFVQSEIFAPMGITGDCKPTGAAPTLSYTFPFDGVQQGFDNDGDWSLACGAGGWHLSANELAAFMAHLRFNDAILAPATRNVMDQKFLAWLDPANNGFSWGSGDFGVYHNHGGDYYPSGGSNGPGLQSCFMDFHIAVQASLLINSRGGDHSVHCQLLADAFDSAWVEGF